MTWEVVLSRRMFQPHLLLCKSYLHLYFTANNHLETNYTILSRERDQLQTNHTNLTRETDDLYRRLYGKLKDSDGSIIKIVK